MKKYISFLFAILILAAACAKVPATGESGSGSSTPVVPPTPDPDPEPAEVTIQVTLPTVDAIDIKAALTANTSGGFNVAWSEGDAILVGGERFTLVSFNGATGLFRGKKPSGTTFDIVYPADTPSAGAYVQAANGDFSHLRYKARLTGVNSFEDVCFSYGWAAEHGGTFSQMGCLQVTLNLPSTATELSTISFEGTGLPTLELSLANGTLSSQSFTAFLPCEGLALNASNAVTIKAKTKTGDSFTNTFFPATQTLADSHIIRLNTSPGKWQRELSGKGSESDPYLIFNADDFNNIRNQLSENTFTYFRMNADIDLSGYTAWTPLNGENKAFGIMFDGQNHKISNFKCTHTSWASLFGVLHGEVKNLIVEDSQVVTTNTSPIGLVAAWCGNIDGSLQGRMENVHVVRGKVSCSAYTIMGGLTGRSGAGTFVNCSFNGTVERTGTTAYESTYHPIGGILGEALAGVSIIDCSTGGTMTVNSGRAAGGIVGQCTTVLNITHCQSTMNITSRDDVVGGIVGYYGSGTISGCTVNSQLKVSAKGSGSSYIGGIAGHSSASIILTDCSYNGTINAYAGVVGGILGQCNTSTGDGAMISRCFSSGTINGTTVVGGIVSRATDSGLIVEDCGTTMDINCTSNYVGGLIGDTPRNTTVKRCYASGYVKGCFALGGLIGRAYGRQGSGDSLDTDVSTTVENCIAFNPSVKTTTSGGENPANHYSGGAVIGCSSRPNTLKNCWRSASMVFDFYSDASLNVLFNHNDSSPSNPLTQPSGSAKWFSPYHGKAASSGQSLCSLAQSLGWDAAVWDFSGSYPSPIKK